MAEFTLTERTEPFTLKEVLDFIDDTNIGKKDAHELKSRIVDVVLGYEDRVIDEFVTEVMKQFTRYEIENGITTVEGCKAILRVVAEQMKGV